MPTSQNQGLKSPTEQSIDEDESSTSAERVGVISCGYDEDQTFPDDPVNQYLFSWRRRAVDLAVCNSQGEFALDWWPMYPDSRPGDMVIFGLAPHERLPFRTTAEDGRAELRSRLAELGIREDLDDVLDWDYMPYSSIIDEGWEYCRAPSLLVPSHPDFSDDGSPIACAGPSFQGLGIVTPQISEFGSSPEDVVTQVDIGHILLFPCCLTDELPRLIGDNSLPVNNFWKPDRPMRARSSDPTPYEFKDDSGSTVHAAEDQSWLTPELSAQLLDELPGLPCFENARASDSTWAQFPRALQKFRKVAAIYRSGREPKGSVFPHVFQLSEAF